jgi:hypothetical protein
VAATAGNGVTRCSERCEEECGGWIVAIPDLRDILIHAEEPTDVADLILCMHCVANPSEEATASVHLRNRSQH